MSVALNAALDPAAAAHQQLRAGAQMTDTGDAVVAMRAAAGGLMMIGTAEGALLSWSLPTNRRAQRLALLDRKIDRAACLSCMDVGGGEVGVSASAAAIGGGGVATAAAAAPGLVAAGLTSGRVLLADLRTGDRLKTWDDFSQRVSAVAMPAFSQQLFASSYDGVFQVRNLEADVVQHSYCACRCPITCMQPVVSAVHEVVMASTDGHVRCLDLRAKQAVAEWSVDRELEVPVRTLCIDNGDANRVHVAYGNGNVQAWDRRNYAIGPLWQRRLLHNDSITALATDGGRLYTGGDDRRVHILNSADGKRIESLDGVAHAVSALLVNDGELFVGGTGKAVRRYDIAGLAASLDAMAAAEAEKKRAAAEEQARAAAEAEAAAAAKDAKKKAKGDKGDKGDGGKKKKK